MKRSLFGCLILVLTAACSDIAGSTDPDQLLGEYTLISIDGFTPPVVVDANGADQLEITAGVVTLGPSAFTDVTELRLTISGVVSTETETATGSWSVTGNTVHFDPSDSDAYTMIWNGADRLTQNFEGHVLVYQR